MSYRCEASTVEGFIQQLAVGYIARGYCFYVAGSVPENKDPQKIDERIVSKYEIDVSKFSRCRRKKGGAASIQYLRFGRYFLILANPGFSRFFLDESNIRNVKVHPILFAGYSVSQRKGKDGKWHASVRIAKNEFRCIKRELLSFALQSSPEFLVCKIARLGFAPYAPIRDQIRMLLRSLNKVRKAAGLERVPFDLMPTDRRIVRPFEWSVEDLRKSSNS